MSDGDDKWQGRPILFLPANEASAAQWHRPPGLHKQSNWLHPTKSRENTMMGFTIRLSWCPLSEFTEDQPNPESEDNKILRKFAAIMRAGPIYIVVFAWNFVPNEIHMESIHMTWHS